MGYEQLKSEEETTSTRREDDFCFRSSSSSYSLLDLNVFILEHENVCHPIVGGQLTRLVRHCTSRLRFNTVPATNQRHW